MANIANSLKAVGNAFVAFGSNIGDRMKHINCAFDALAAADDISFDRQNDASPVYDTAPVGGPADQGRFLNGVIMVRTGLSPKSLLSRLHEIERENGRIRSVANGPRTLDLDLLMYDQLVMAEQGLELPHPRMHLRSFVLRPLVDLAPDLVHPVFQRTVSELLNDLADEPIPTVFTAHR